MRGALTIEVLICIDILSIASILSDTSNIKLFFSVDDPPKWQTCGVLFDMLIVLLGKLNLGLGT